MTHSGQSIEQVRALLYADGVNLLRAFPRREPPKRAQQLLADAIAYHLQQLAYSYGVHESDRSPGGLDFAEAAADLFKAADALLTEARSDSQRARGEVASAETLDRYYAAVTDALQRLCAGYGFGDE